MVELGDGEAGDAGCEKLLERGFGSLDAEGALELGKGCVVRLGRVRAPGVSEDAPDDPVGAGDDSVEGRGVGVDE